MAETRIVVPRKLCFKALKSRLSNTIHTHSGIVVAGGRSSGSAPSIRRSSGRATTSMDWRWREISERASKGEGVGVSSPASTRESSRVFSTI